MLLSHFFFQEEKNKSISNSTSCFCFILSNYSFRKKSAKYRQEINSIVNLEAQRTDFGLLESGRVIDTVASHGRHFSLALQILHDLRLVEGLHTGKQAGFHDGLGYKFQCH